MATAAAEVAPTAGRLGRAALEEEIASVAPGNGKRIARTSVAPPQIAPKPSVSSMTPGEPSSALPPPLPLPIAAAQMATLSVVNAGAGAGAGDAGGASETTKEARPPLDRVTGADAKPTPLDKAAASEEGTAFAAGASEERPQLPEDGLALTQALGDEMKDTELVADPPAEAAPHVGPAPPEAGDEQAPTAD